MAESRNPAGYEKQKLYQSSNTPSQRVTTHAEMLKVSEFKTPMIFVVDNDEETGGEDVLYYWSGIEVRLLPKEGDYANPDITVDTYEEALQLFTGDIKRSIFINQASQYNEPGEFFTWFPEVQKVAYLGIDFNYLD